VGAGYRDSAYATVEVDTAGGTVWAFGSVVDNGTNDPTTVPVSATPVAGQQYVAGVAHAPGSMGSQWRTDLAVVNPGTMDAPMTLTFVPYGSGTPIVKVFTLGAGRTREWRDVLVSLFQLGQSDTAKGTVQIMSVMPVHASARTYNQGDEGTFGQYLPAIEVDQALGAGALGVIPQLKDTAAFRSNLGILNVGDAACTVRFALYGASGQQLGSSATSTVPSGEYWQQDSVFPALGASGAEIGYATVEVETAGGSVWAFGSVVDNGTNDPTTVPVLEWRPGRRVTGDGAGEPGPESRLAVRPC